MIFDRIVQSLARKGWPIMRIPVLVESVSGSGFRAKGGELLAPSAVGTTRDKAIARLKPLIADRLVGGTELISLEVENHWAFLASAPGWSELAGRDV